jgi:RNA polymerase sigma-70 factor (ECF subfamily)
MNQPPATSRSAAPAASPATDLVPADDDVTWLAPLRGHGTSHDHAVAELHRLLLAASRFEVRRRAAAFGLSGSSELDDLAQQAADDAVVAVLQRLDRFEGRSRFTTWAYKFAIHIAGVAVRRHAWRDRTIATDSRTSFEELADLGHDPAHTAETNDLLRRIASATTRLTARQRDVLLALTVEGVPIDVLADRLGSNRNALYKTLHDARTRLRRILDEDQEVIR